jgi:hypothetical protein
MGIHFKPSKIEARTPMEKFGLKKLSLIEKLLKKFYEDESFWIRNIKISKSKKLTSYSDPYSNSFLSSERQFMIDETEIRIYYYTSKPKGIYWSIVTKPKIEDMVVEIFGLKNQGIDKVQLEFISDDRYIY